MKKIFFACFVLVMNSTFCFARANEGLREITNATSCICMVATYLNDYGVNLYLPRLVTFPLRSDIEILTPVSQSAASTAAIYESSKAASYCEALKTQLKNAGICAN